ncbi:MAG: PEP-CTERM sorting domain-containing protein [Pirellulales bacterium]|nr:PEP-CTERM sorting domain-containing protein [Pirellulales bacterium]
MTYTIDGANGTYEAKLIIVPEPGTLVLLATGLAGLLVLAMRRRRRS